MQNPKSHPATFCDVHLPRCEQRHDEARPYVAYLMRLSSNLGLYPSPTTWYELRFPRIAKLHARLQAAHRLLRLPRLPRTRWLSNRHPNYVAQMCQDLQRYFQQLVSAWCRHFGSFDGFILLMHAIQSDLALPVPGAVQIDLALPIYGEPMADVGHAASPFRGASARLASETTPVNAPATLVPAAFSELSHRIEDLSWQRYAQQAESAFSSTAGCVSTFDDIWGGLASSSGVLWRVMNFDLVAQDSPSRPILLQRAAYIVLAAQRVDPAGMGDATRSHIDDWRVHFWIGESCGVDQAGAAAALSVQLSCAVEVAIGRRCSHARELQGEETYAFRSLFGGRLSYVDDGKVSRYWRQRKSTSAPARLFCVAGGWPSCLGSVAQAAPTEVGLDDAACYVLDAPSQDEARSEIFQWHGHAACLRNKALAMLLSHAIRSNDRHGLADLHVLYSPKRAEASTAPRAAPDVQDTYARFRSRLGSALAPPLMAAAPLAVYRLEVLRAAPRTVAARSQKPPTIRVLRACCQHSLLCSTLLTSSHTCVLDCGSDIFVWSGRASCGYARWAALVLATRVRGLHITRAALHRESEGCESTLYRSKFQRWHWMRESNMQPWTSRARTREAHKVMPGSAFKTRA